jgi:hypothetical protein
LPESPDESPDAEPPADPSDAEPPADPPDAEPLEGGASEAGAAEPEWAEVEGAEVEEPALDPADVPSEAAAFAVPDALASERAAPGAESEAGTGGGTGADAEAGFSRAASSEPVVAGSGAGAEEALSVLRRGSSSVPIRLMATPLATSTTRADANASPTKAPRRC